MRAAADIDIDVYRKLGITEEDVEERVQRCLQNVQEESLQDMYFESIQDFKEDSIIDGKIVDILDDQAVIDVGYKSEGFVPLEEFEDAEALEIGEEREFFLQSVEDEGGTIQISREKGREIRAWEEIMATAEEGDIVEGKVVRKVKGGLLVDIGGVTVFLPASQVEIRRVPDIEVFIGEEIRCKIIKIDRERMNIIVSRRKLIEEQREEQKKKLLKELEPGQVREGVVKNIADFGVFVDLGGVDGLLHITDLSWGRVEDPREVVELDEKINVKVLDVDREEERISLGLKQLTKNPWDEVEKKYPVGSRLKARVVNILPYGAFLELEEGLEGLLHISEMSWTKRVRHPSEIVSIGDVLEVVILSVNKEKQEISLSLKQTERNPWFEAKERYVPGTRIEGQVRNLTSYGAFIQLEDNIDGLLHVSDISWTRNISDPSEVFDKGDMVEAMVLTIDAERQRVSLGKKQLTLNPWVTTIPEKFSEGTRITGPVKKITSFGAFVRLEDELDGLLHVSKIAVQNVGKPGDVLGEGDEVEVEVLSLDKDEGKISLSLVDVKESEHWPDKLTPFSSEEAEEKLAERMEEPEEITPEPEEEEEFDEPVDPSTGMDQPEPLAEAGQTLDRLQDRIRKKEVEESREERAEEHKERSEEEASVDQEKEIAESDEEETVQEQEETGEEDTEDVAEQTEEQQETDEHTAEADEEIEAEAGEDVQEQEPAETEEASGEEEVTQEDVSEEEETDEEAK